MTPRGNEAWRCRGCAQALSREQLRRVAPAPSLVDALYACPHCGAVAVEERNRASQALPTAYARSARYPFQREAVPILLGVMLVPAVLRAVDGFVMVGGDLSALADVVEYLFLFEIVRATARGHDTVPAVPDFLSGWGS